MKKGVRRTGVSLDNELLKKFDEFIKRRGLRSRSQAICEAIRYYMSEYSWEKAKGNVVGVISIIYDHTAHELSDYLTDVQHNFIDVIRSSIHVHLDKNNCLEVITCVGDAKRIKDLAKRISARKGIKIMRVTVL